jgi:hypothetical protein
MTDIKFYEDSIELIQGSERFILFKKYIKFIKESKNKRETTLIMDSESYPDVYHFITKCDYDTVKKNLNLKPLNNS